MGSSRNLPDPAALTIAGFDPSSGAGVTADLAVFAAHGIFGTSAITALTVQSTTGVRRVKAVDADLLAETLACLHEDLPPAGIKVGMLGDAEQVRTVAEYLRAARSSGTLTVVLDPVIRSSSGADLLSPAGLHALREDLLPLVDCVTPNIEELAMLTGQTCRTQEEIEEAAHSLNSGLSGLSVLAKGGHREKPDDLLLHQGRFTLLEGERIDTKATHGTGCALSSSLLCGLLKGMTYPDAAAAAKAYVRGAMLGAEPRGRGQGPMDLFWPISGHKRN